MKALGVKEKGAITLDVVDTVLSTRANRAEDRAAGDPADAVVWDELANRSFANMERIFPFPDQQSRLMGLVMIKNSHEHFKSLWDGTEPKPEKTDDEILADLLGEDK